MNGLSPRRIVLIVTASTLSVALLGGVALASFGSPMSPATFATMTPGAIEMAAAHLGIGRGGDMLEAALTYIGITREQYIAGVQAGKTLAQLATENGKTRDGLIAAMVAAGTAALDAAKADLPNKAAQLADATRPVGPRGGFHFDLRVNGVHIGANWLATAATYLGTTEADLRTKVSSGQTLAQIAGATAGKSRDGLVTAITDAAKADITAAQQAGRITAEQATNMAAKVTDAVTQFVDGSLPMGGKPFGFGGSGRHGR